MNMKDIEHGGFPNSETKTIGLVDAKVSRSRRKLQAMRKRVAAPKNLAAPAKAESQSGTGESSQGASESQPGTGESFQWTAERTCFPKPPIVKFVQLSANPKPSATEPIQKEKNMASITLTRSNTERKNPRLVIYNIEGRTGSVQFLSTLFGGSQDSQGNPPETLTLNGDIPDAKPREVKVQETKEQRKARLAALPKPTLAEKFQKSQERTEALRAKLAAMQAPAEGQSASM